MSSLARLTDSNSNRIIHEEINKYFMSDAIYKPVDFRELHAVSRVIDNSFLTNTDYNIIHYIINDIIGDIKNYIDDRRFLGVTDVYIEDDNITFGIRISVRFNLSQSLKEKKKELRILMGDKLFNILSDGYELTLNNISKTIDLFNTMKREKETFKKIYGSEYKLTIIKYLIANKKIKRYGDSPMDLFYGHASTQEQIIDKVLSYKNNSFVNKDYIIKNLIDGNEIEYNQDGILIIKLTRKNKNIMSNKWCITNSNHYWHTYNDTKGCTQYIYYNFKDKEYIGFNYDGEEISNAFNWENKNYNKKDLEKLLTNISFM